MLQLREAIKAGIRAIWASVPRRLRLFLNRNPMIVRLDYDKADIRLVVDSATDLRRAQSCAKEPGTIRWIEDEVGEVFYDIGANVGAYSLVAWAASEGRTRVVAFEPGFSTFPQLCRNILLNGSAESITPLNIALSSTSGTQVFRYRDIESGAAEHPGLGQDELGGPSPQGKIALEQPMLTLSLDAAIKAFGLPAPVYIKIDVDGHELQILQGARDTLGSGSVRGLQIEIDEEDPRTEEIRQILATSGFHLRRKVSHDHRIADLVYGARERVGLV